jgi:hypothetical protein
MALVSVGALVAGFAVNVAPASATITPVGSCSGLLGLGTLKSSFIDPNTGKAAGLTSDDHDLKLAVKGVDPTTKLGTNLGSCGFLGGSVTPGGNGTFSIAKWSSVLSSPATDCVSESPTATDEWTLSGKLTIGFTDLSQMQVALAVAGFRTGDLNQTDSTGIVTKGHVAGAFVQNQTWFDPIVKDTTQTTATPYFGYSFQPLAGIGACAGTSDTALTLGGGSDITGITIGAGTDPEHLSADSANGLTFTLGE